MPAVRRRPPPEGPPLLVRRGSCGTHLDTKEARLVVCDAPTTATQFGDENLMRWKIIAVNSIIVLLVGVLSYALLRAALGDLASNTSQLKADAERTLAA